MQTASRNWELGNIQTTDTALISFFFLSVKTVMRELAITHFLLFMLKKLL